MEYEFQPVSVFSYLSFPQVSSGLWKSLAVIKLLFFVCFPINNFTLVLDDVDHSIFVLILGVCHIFILYNYLMILLQELFLQRLNSSLKEERSIY